MNAPIRRPVRVEQYRAEDIQPADLIDVADASSALLRWQPNDVLTGAGGRWVPLRSGFGAPVNGDGVPPWLYVAQVFTGPHAEQSKEEAGDYGQIVSDTLNAQYAAFRVVWDLPERDDLLDCLVATDAKTLLRVQVQA